MPLVPLTDEDVSKAYRRFVDVYYPDQIGRGLAFCGFLGMKESPHAYYEPTKVTGWHLNEKEARLIKMLAGPHYKAVIKIMELQGYRHDTPISV